MANKIIRQADPLEFHPAQRKIAQCDARFRIVCCGRRFGKALDLNTEIPTSKGFKLLRDIEMGDFVFDDAGKQVEVTYVGEVLHDRDCYEVIFSDGNSIVADAGHLWTVETKNFRKNIARTPNTKIGLKNITTEEMAGNLYIGKETNFSIPTVEPINYDAKKLNIDPYLLGIWLGDGVSANGNITTADKEVLETFRDAGYITKQYNENDKYTYSVKIDGNVWREGKHKGKNKSFATELKGYDLLNNKHVPNSYKFTSIEDRLSLLQGLMDSDGCISDRGHCEFTGMNKRLVEDVYEIICSLGIKATLKSCEAKIDGVLKGIKYRITFTTGLDVFRLERKRVRQSNNHRPNIRRRFIKKILKVESRPVKCIGVANETSLFVAGRAYIPTHNTTLAVYEMVGKAVAKKETRIAYIAPTYQQARDIAWEELKKICSPITVQSNEARLEISVKTQDGGMSTIALRGYEAVETLRGQKFHFLVLDEVAMMRNFFTGWEEVLRPTLTDYRGEALFISTPKGFNHFYELYRKENNDEDYKSFHFSTYDNPHVPKDEVDKAKQELPEDKFSQEYMADFRKTEGLVYKEFNREKHVVGDEIKNKIWADVLVGVDFGYTNPAAISKICKDGDGRYFITREWYKPKKTTEEIAEVAREFEGRKYYPDPAEPDRVEVLEKAGLYVREVKKGRGSIEAGIDKVRELFKQNRLFIHKDCINTILEFETYHYPENKSGLNEKELPEPENDHLMDAIRYAIMMDEPISEEPTQEFNLYTYNYD